MISTNIISPTKSESFHKQLSYLQHQKMAVWKGSRCCKLILRSNLSESWSIILRKHQNHLPMTNSFCYKIFKFLQKNGHIFFSTKPNSKILCILDSPSKISPYRAKKSGGQVVESSSRRRGLFF